MSHCVLQALQDGLEAHLVYAEHALLPVALFNALHSKRTVLTGLDVTTGESVRSPPGLLLSFRRRAALPACVRSFAFDRACCALLLAQRRSRSRVAA